MSRLFYNVSKQGTNCFYMVFVALIGVLTLLCSVDEFKDDFFASRRTKGFVLGGMGVCFLLLFVVTLVDCIKETKNQIQQQADLEMGKLNFIISPLTI